MKLLSPKNLKELVLLVNERINELVAVEKAKNNTAKKIINKNHAKEDDD